MKNKYLSIILFLLVTNSTLSQNFSLDVLLGKEPIIFKDKDLKLRDEAYEAFLEMRKAAYNEGIEIIVISAYRDYYRQQQIWERKYWSYIEKGLSEEKAIDKIIEYSTIPGTSRHHWGTEIDIIQGKRSYTGNALDPDKFKENGVFYELKDWLDKNAHKFGFYLTYTDHPKRKGFKYEPWHYSYAPLSKPMLKSFRKQNLMKIISELEIDGSEHFSNGFITNYIQENILGINKELL